jgi:hypothetical protein
MEVIKKIAGKKKYSGPEPIQTIVLDYVLAKFTRQWLTLFYDRSTFTKDTFLVSLASSLISEIICLMEERS